MDTFKCKECSEEFKKDWLFKKHVTQKHFPYPEYVIKHNYKSIHPTCKCGCGEKTKYDSAVKDFRKFVHGHLARTKNNWSKDSPYFEKSTKRSAATRRKQYKNGERKVWNNGVTKNDDSKFGRILKEMGKNTSKNTDRAKKISDALTGQPKSQEHIEKIKVFQKKYWSDPLHKEEQSHKRLVWMKEHDYTIKSKTEDLFEKLLIPTKIPFERQKYVRPIKSFFDFYIPKSDAYVEIDGDFWHCNESLGFYPKYDSQKKNLINDKKKNDWCKQNNKKLLRFWASDIEKSPVKVLFALLKELKNQI